MLASSTTIELFGSNWVLQSCKQLGEDVVVLAFYEVDNLNEED